MSKQVTAKNILYFELRGTHAHTHPHTQTHTHTHAHTHTHTGRERERGYKCELTHYYY